MKKLISLFLLSLPLACSAQDPMSVISAKDIRSHMFFLAADEMAGRSAASPEARIAANYIATEFMHLGLKPVGDNGTYFQNFSMVSAMLDPVHTSLVLKLGSSTKTLQIQHDFSYFFVQSATPTQVDASVVFAGYGVNAPEYDYNDFAGLNLRGKVAMVLDREPQADDPASRFKGRWDTVHTYWWYKIEQVRATGAAGLLIIEESKTR